MKFVHLSDLHIGLRLYNYDLTEEQEDILRQATEQVKEEQPDAVLVAGDVYDKTVPSAEAIRLFDDFLLQLHEAAPNAEIMIISGNHDSPQRLDQYRSFLKRMKLHMVGLPPQNEDEYIEKVTLNDEFGPVNFYLLPFIKPTMVKGVVGTDEKGNNLSYQESLRRLFEREKIDRSERNVLVSHQFYYPTGKDPADVERMESEEIGRTVGNIDAVSAELLSPFDYAALGHIHKPWLLGSDPCKRYCGTPYPYSIDEERQEKGTVVVEMGAKGTITTRVLPLVPKRAVRTIEGLLDDVLEEGCDDFVRIVLTDPAGEALVNVRERLIAKFSKMLEMRRKHIRSSGVSGSGSVGVTNDPFELCCLFLGETTPEEDEILSEIVNSVKGEN